jgi:hypothetical protein
LSKASKLSPTVIVALRRDRPTVARGGETGDEAEVDARQRPLAMDVQLQRWERRVEIRVLVAALLVVSVIAIEEAAVGDPWPVIAEVTNWLIWLGFLPRPSFCWR